MKKMLSVVTALTVTMSSFSAFASFYNEDPFSGNLTGPNGYKVPVEDGVETKVKVESKWDAESTFADHNATALQKVYKNNAEIFDAQATLDMTNVAEEWKAYLDVASEFIQSKIPGTTDEAARNMAIEYVNLTGEYTITIVWKGSGSGAALKGIENTELAKETVKTGYTWETVGGYSAEDFFVEADTDPVAYSEDASAETKTFVLKMKVKDNIDKTKLNVFFGDANPDKKFVLSIPDNKVDQLGTYEITGTFSGYVDISVNVPGATNNAVSSKVVFGTGADKYVPDFSPKAEDVEYVSLYEDSKDDGHHSSGGGGVTRPTPTPTPTPTVEPTETPSATPTVEPQTGGTDNGAKLDYDNHYAYIIGYPTDDGTKIVRPENNITRAEVATIFFRLLTDESRTKFWTTENSFTDVESADWYNNAVSTATQAGIVNGYEDGTFRPNNPITRAEFAAIASRFANVPFDGEDMFSDITGHWAAANINEAATVGWINGYEDGTFRPDRNITRAEAMTLINRVLYRYVEADDLRDDMIKWTDNTEDKWYYANVQEATNSHTYEREAIGTYEAWTAITEPRDWEALEKETSTAASAGKEESAFEGIDETEDASDVTMEDVVDEATNAADEETDAVIDETTNTSDETVDETTDAADEVVEDTADETTEEVVE